MNVAMVVILVVVGVAALGFIGVVLAGVFGKTRSPIIRLAVTTRVPIADVSGGEHVKIQGHITHTTPSPLTTRVTGEPVVCSHLTLTYNHQGTRHFELRRQTAFVIADETGEAYVNVDNATVMFGDRKAHGRLDGDAITGWARDALQNDGLMFTGTPAGHLDIVEQVLIPGDTVAVMGRARWEIGTDDAVQSDRRAARRLVIEADPELGITISGDRSAFDDPS